MALENVAFLGCSELKVAPERKRLALGSSSKLVELAWRGSSSNQERLNLYVSPLVRVVQRCITHIARLVRGQTCIQEKLNRPRIAT